MTRKDFLKLYFEKFHRTLGAKRFVEIVELASTVGIISEEPDPNNKKQNIMLLTGRGVLMDEASASMLAPEKPKEEKQSQTKLPEMIHTPQGVSNTFFSLNQVKNILELKPSLAGHCSYCGKGSSDMVNYPKPLLSYAVETFKGKKYLICEDCGLQIRKELERNE
jgi:hypothetical protein